MHVASTDLGGQGDQAAGGRPAREHADGNWRNVERCNEIYAAAALRRFPSTDYDAATPLAAPRSAATVLAVDRASEEVAARQNGVVRMMRRHVREIPLVVRNSEHLT